MFLSAGRVGIWSVMVLCGLSCPAQPRTFALPGPPRERPSVIATTKNEASHLQTLQEPALHQEPTGTVDTEVSGSGQQGKAVRAHRPGWEQGGVGGLPGTGCSERRSPWC